MYKDYIFKTKDKPKKSSWKIALKVIKILIYSFLVLSMLWGCSEMFVSKYNTYQVVDSSGGQVFKSGIFFEILFYHLGFATNKLHYGHITNGNIFEYPYLSIDSWSSAFQKTQSPFYGFFVYPTAWLLVSIMDLFGGPNNGVAVIFSIFIMAFLMKLITIAFSWKSQMNQEKMQLLQVKQQEIKNRYGKAAKSDPILKRKQQMETMELYKKHKMNPAAQMGTMFLSFPFLFALYISIKSTRVLKTATIGQITLIDKPWSMIVEGHLAYLALLLAYIPMQLMSMFTPTILGLMKAENKTPEQKKAKRRQFIMQGVISVVYLFIVTSIAAGVAIYWTFSAFLQICQTLAFHYGRIWYGNKGKRIKIKNKKIKLKTKDELYNSKQNVFSIKNNSTIKGINNNLSEKNNLNNNTKLSKNKRSTNNTKNKNKKNKFTL